MLLNSDHEERNALHTYGVALILSKEARNALLGWESHRSRIIKVSFKTKKEGITMNVIQCHATTNDSNDGDKHQIYEIDQRGAQEDLIILMGDLDVKVGMGNNDYPDIMGQHGLGENKGECSFNKSVIGCRIFPHKPIHKTTWVSSDHITKN
ncbi:unnamed protein product [Schistosoma bovis]|nr:unnamed protein product [Schistosoma bovis]